MLVVITLVSDERFGLVNRVGCWRGNITVGVVGIIPRRQYGQDSRSAGRESNPELVTLEAGMQPSQLSVMRKHVFFLTLRYFVAFW